MRKMRVHATLVEQVAVVRVEFDRRHASQSVVDHVAGEAGLREIGITGDARRDRQIQTKAPGVDDARRESPGVVDHYVVYVGLVEVRVVDECGLQ